MIDVFSRRIVGWRLQFPPERSGPRPLKQALWERDDSERGRLVHHSDRGVQYLSIRYTERLGEAGIEPSVGNRGDSYHNALYESMIGLYKTEVIRQRGPWRGLEDVEFATLEWVGWFNYQRLLEPIGYIPRLNTKKHSTSATRKQPRGDTQLTRSPRKPGRFIPILAAYLLT